MVKQTLPPRMATDSPQLNDLASQPSGVLPGTTFASESRSKQSDTDSAFALSSTGQPSHVDGPLVNNRATTLTLFSPPQLLHSPLLPSLYRTINNAFRRSHERSNSRLEFDRLSYQGQLHDELGTKPGTFTYVLSYSGTDDVVATASAKPHAINARKDSTWLRLEPIPDGKEAWELSTMAVDPSLQRQGLASYLMRVTEEEVKRRFTSDVASKEGKKLVLVITTVKERNEAFYMRKEFKRDYEIWYPPGTVSQDNGLHVLFMSKEVEVLEYRQAS